MQERVKSVGAILVSVVTAAIAIWWLYEVAVRLGVPPVKDDQGNIVIDQFQRAKDILIVVLPLFSASIAYWVGSSGTADAKKEAQDSKSKLDAVLDASPQGMLQRAKELHPEAFTKLERRERKGRTSMANSVMKHQDDDGDLSIFVSGDVVLIACAQGHYWVVGAKQQSAETVKSTIDELASPESAERLLSAM